MIRTLILMSIILQGCVSQKDDVSIDPNEFTTFQDTLIITTEKQKGDGLFAGGVSPMNFRDFADSFPYPISVPEDITDLQRSQWSTDFRDSNEYYVDIIQGKIDEDFVFIIDENHNQDLTDDSVRIFSPIDWKSEESLIRCKYSIYKHQTKQEDSTWLRIGVLRDALWCGKSEHLVGAFSIRKEEFKIGIVAFRQSSFTYETWRDPMLTLISPTLALISQNSIERDTLYERDLLKNGEVVKLKDSYYRYDSISYYGDSLILVRENNFNKLEGIQVGMMAPEFRFISILGDTIESRALNDRTLVIVNSCGCGGDKQSTEAFFEMTEAVGEKAYVMRLDHGISKTTNKSILRGKKGFQIDMDNEYNNDLYSKYREAYCSRTCYVVNTDNKLIDKFPISEWKQNLPRLNLKN